MVEVELIGVKVDVRSNAPVLLLQEVTEPRRTLPIFIGAPEASAIELGARGVEPPRPLTHDLLREILDIVGITLERVVITEVRQTTYYAELELVHGKIPYIISCRPSDAVAVAVRNGAPIFVANDLIDAEGVVIDTNFDTVEGNSIINTRDDSDTTSGSNPDELVGEFLDFLDNIKPEDFS